MKFKKTNYPDGSFYTTVDFEDTNTCQDLTFKINSYEDLWQLRQIKDVCDFNKVKVNLTIPSQFDAQADRRFNPNEPSGLKLICQFINDMKFENVSIFHPHNAEVIEALIDNVKIIDNSEFIKRIIYDKLYEESNFKSKGEGFKFLDKLDNDLILMSTDAGGFKPLMKLCDKIEWKGETFSASKSRKIEEGKSKLTQQVDRQDFGGKDVLIIDDICVYGGTFVGLAKMLKERNCGKLYLAVSHLTVEKPNPELFSLFDKVFTTNSKYDEYFPIPHKDGGGGDKAENLEVIKLF